MSALAPARPGVAPATRVPPAWWRSLAAIVLHTLRTRGRAPLTWGGGLGAMGALMAALWPSIEGSVDELMRSYPEGLKTAFGIDELNSVEAYVDAEMLSLIVPLAIAFLAVRVVIGCTVGAEERGHLDVLLSLPLSRRVLLAGSWLATGAIVAAALAVAWGLTCAAGVVAGTGIDAGTMAAGFGNVWPLAMAFAGLAALAAGVTSRAAVATGAAIGVLVAMYVVDLVGKLADTLEPVRVVSAFRYYGSAVQDGIDLSHGAGLVAAGAALLVAGIALFERRDLR
jgi:ABC-2 type transport system permease protein